MRNFRAGSGPVTVIVGFVLALGIHTLTGWDAPFMRLFASGAPPVQGGPVYCKQQNLVV
jgi:hypothetical protein